MSARRRPVWWSVALTVLAVLVFVRLGMWQLHRADEKEQLLRRYATSAQAPEIGFAQALAQRDDDIYPRVRVAGRYRTERIYLLDNPHHDSRGGMEVFAPFQPDGSGRWLLVDLGFLPASGDDKPPQVPVLPDTPQVLHGLYQPLPGHGLELGGDALARQSNWPKTTIYLDPAQVADDLHHTLFPRMLALDAEPDSVYLRVHALELSSMPPARHRAYAFQWFTFALAAIVLWVVLHRRRPQRKQGD